MFAAVESEADAIGGPMVLFCLKCKVIVADSYSLLKINADMNTMTLTGASNVSRSADVYTSKSGSDVGSTYFRFNCSSCQAALGRYYLTTSKDLDDLREKFTFTVDSLGSYELGKTQHGKASELLVSEGALADTEATGPAERNSGTGESGGADPKALEAEVQKTQHVLMQLIERVDTQDQVIHRLTQQLAMLITKGAQPQGPSPSPPRAANSSSMNNDSNNTNKRPRS